MKVTMEMHEFFAMRDRIAELEGRCHELCDLLAVHQPVPPFNAPDDEPDDEAPIELD